jgi:hypothetical protein
MPIIARQVTNYIVAPLLKAGDNKIFTHKRFKSFFTDNDFTIKTIYKKGFKQIIVAEK